MGKWVCKICGYVYDETKEKTPFEDLPDSWTCPLCGADKGSFVPEGEKGKPKAHEFHSAITEDIRELTAGELSALCSNLARGCEKQYKGEESELFKELADFFAEAVQDIPDGDTSKLAELIQRDMEEGYPALHSSAEEEADRGTQRICVWGEKVTGMLYSLLKRREKEGDKFIENTQVWVCTVCGFIYIGDKAPELCPVCKVPTWKFEKIEGRN